MKHILVLLFLVCCFSSNAQIVFRDITQQFANKSTLNGVRVVAPPANLYTSLNSARSAMLPWGNSTLHIQLQTMRVLTENATVIAQHDAHSENIDIPAHGMVRGTIQGKQQSRVFIAAFENYFFGLLQWHEPGRGLITLLMQPIANNNVQALVLKDVSESKPREYDCFAEQLPGYQHQADSVLQLVRVDNILSKETDNPQAQPTHTLHVAVECNYSYFKRSDTSLTKAVCYALSLVGTSSAIYSQDARIELRVPFLRVFTTPDPYPGEIGEKLNKLRELWDATMPHVQRSITTMLSGEGGGGLAYVGVLCNYGWGYGVCGVDGGYNFPQDDYLWDVDVFSHELGHNIGSPHTHNCSWAPAIDSCWNAEGGCFEYKTPRRGTIMSYCHLQNKGTSLQIHPRVASLMQRSAANSACVEVLPIVHDTDVSIQTIAAPKAGAIFGVQRKIFPAAQILNNGKTAVRSTIQFRVLGADGTVKFSPPMQEIQLGSGSSQLVQCLNSTTLPVGTYLVEARVTTTGDKRAVNDVQTTTFAVADIPMESIGIIKPNGGEVWNANEPVTLSYVTTGIKNVRIELSTNNGSTWQPLRYSQEATNSEQTILAPARSSTTCLVRITSLENGDVVDVSDAPFSIITKYDLEVVDLVVPQVNSTVASPFAPKVQIRNNGTVALSDVNVDIAIRWVESSVERATQTVTVARIAPGATVVVDFAPTPVLGNGKHVFTARCRASNDENTSNDTRAWEFNTSGLSAPHGLVGLPGNNRIIVEWKNKSIPGVKTEIWRGSTPLDAQRIGVVRSTVLCFVDTTVKNQQRYVYQLRNVDNSRNSVFSETIVVEPRQYGVEYSFLAPELLAPTNGQLDVPLPVALRWAHQSRECSFELQLATDAAFIDKYFVTVTNNSGWFTPPTQFNATTFWRVRAIAPGYTGPWSVVHKYKTTDVCAGSKLQFNGANQQAISDEFTWEGGPVTVEFWTYVESANIKPASAFAVGERDEIENRFQAHVPWDNNRVYWDYGNLNRGGRVEASFEGYTDKWTHVALVSDGTAFQGIYLDGVLVASTTNAMSPSPLRKLTVGAMSSGNHLNGSIDELRIWSVARTEEEIQSTMYQRIPLPTSFPTLQGYWPVVSTTQQTVNDASQYQHALTVVSDEMIVPSDAPISCNTTTELPRPLAIKETAKGSGEYNITWSSVPAAHWYELRIATRYQKPFVFVKNIPGYQNNYVLRGFPVDSVLSVTVQAFTAGKKSKVAEYAFTTRGECRASVINFNRTFTAVAKDFAFTGGATTIEFWTYINSNQMFPSSAFMIGTEDVLEKRFQVHAPWEDKTLYFDFGNINTTGRLVAPVDKYLDTWMHLALVSDGVREMKLYLNGEVIATSDFAALPGDMMQISLGGNMQVRNLHNGQMHDFRIWNTARSAEKIREDMYTHIATSDELLGSWMLYEGQSDTVYDATSYQNNASGTAIEWSDIGTGISVIPLKIYISSDKVQQGDTVRYRVSGSRTASYSWMVTNGKIVSGGGRSDVQILWDSSKTHGSVTVIRYMAGGCTDTASIDVPLRPTGIQDDATNIARYKLFPNPTESTTTLYVQAMPEAREVVIYGIDGKQVVTCLIPAGVSELPLPTHTLASGAYTCVVGSGATKEVNIQFVKQ